MKYLMLVLSFVSYGIDINQTEIISIVYSQGQEFSSHNARSTIIYIYRLPKFIFLAMN